MDADELFELHVERIESAVRAAGQAAKGCHELQSWLEAEQCHSEQ